MKHRHLHDGRSDGLQPLKSVNLSTVNCFSDLLQQMEQTAFGGRSLGQAHEVLMDMFRQPECGVVMTISGAMTVAKQGQIICDLIDRGCVQAIIATGALMAHGLTESIGLTHYRYDPSQSDKELFDKGYNRIYDTLEMEANLNELSEMVADILEQDSPDNTQWSSARFCRAVGKRLHQLDGGPGILKSAFEKNVPVFVPAFTDSELGLDFATTAILQAIGKLSPEQRSQLSVAEALTQVPAFNPFLDLYEYARLVTGYDRLGIFTIGGGVPRNWAQQVGPFIDITNGRCGTNLTPPRFQYAVRICPEPVHWGGLSGCTYSEGVSWGKFVPPEEGGRFSEVYADATVVLPLLIKAVFEQLDQ
jgi:deoxyhypusine synthase